MANKNNTREGIHSGLSQSKSDEKWGDMLNFRCSDNRTFAVPRRLEMLRESAGFHTVLHGVGDVNYAIGSEKSFLFRSHDDTAFQRLWRARLERVTSTEDQSESLKIRGSYTGLIPRNIRLTVVSGLLVLDSDWPETPEVVVETPYAPQLNCNSDSGDYYLHLHVTGAGSELSAAEVAIYQGTMLVGEFTTNAHGLFSLFLPKNFYSVFVTHSNYDKTVQENFVIVDEDVLLNVDFIVNPINYIGLNISVRYSSTLGPVPGGHACDSAIYKVLGNGIEIGIANLNNAVDGGDRQADFTISSELAQELANVSVDGTVLELSLVCDPTQPGFDLVEWSGTCHTNLAWVVVTNNESVELYNGAPSENFLTINF